MLGEVGVVNERMACALAGKRTEFGLVLDKAMIDTVFACNPIGIFAAVFSGSQRLGRNGISDIQTGVCLS